MLFFCFCVKFGSHSSQAFFYHCWKVNMTLNKSCKPSICHLPCYIKDSVLFISHNDILIQNFTNKLLLDNHSSNTIVTYYCYNKYNNSEVMFWIIWQFKYYFLSSQNTKSSIQLFFATKLHRNITHCVFIFIELILDAQ